MSPGPSCLAAVWALKPSRGRQATAEATAPPSTAAHPGQGATAEPPVRQPGVARNSACGLEVVEQRGRFTRRVVDATSRRLLASMSHAAQVTNVDHLGCRFGCVGDQNSSAWCAGPGEPQRPIPAPVEDIAGTADEPDPGDQRPARLEDLLDLLFARDFRLPVAVHALHHPTRQRRQQRGLLIRALGAVVGVHVARGDEDVHAHLVRQRPHLSRLPRRVHHDGPLLFVSARRTGEDGCGRPDLQPRQASDLRRCPRRNLEGRDALRGLWYQPAAAPAEVMPYGTRWKARVALVKAGTKLMMTGCGGWLIHLKPSMALKFL